MRLCSRVDTYCSTGRGQATTERDESGSLTLLYGNHLYRQVISPITDSTWAVLHLSEKSSCSDFDVIYLNLSKIVLFFK